MTHLPCALIALLQDPVSPAGGLKFDGWESFTFSHWGPWLATRLLHAAFYFIVAYFLNRMWRSLLRRIKVYTEARAPSEIRLEDTRVITLLAVLRRVGSGLILGAVLLLILKDFGLEIGPLLAGLGIAGAALGFGAQYLVQDWIAGFFTIVEDNFRVGDLVEANGMRGTVERLNMRTTHLRALGGEMHIIQNGTIRAMTNFTRQWGRAIVDVGVDYNSDMGFVFEALAEVGRRAAADPGMAPAFLEPLDVVGVTQLADSQITVRVWVKTDPQRKWEVERHLRRIALEVFAERGISIPFPQRTVHMVPATVDLAARPTPGKEGDA